MQELDRKTHLNTRAALDSGFGDCKLNVEGQHYTFPNGFAEVKESQTKSSIDKYRNDAIAYISGDREDLVDKFFIVGEGASVKRTFTRMNASAQNKPDYALLSLLYGLSLAHNHQLKHENINVALITSIPEVEGVHGTRIKQKTEGTHRARIGNAVHNVRIKVVEVIGEGAKVGGDLPEFLTIDPGHRTLLLRHWKNGEVVYSDMRHEGASQFFDDFEKLARLKTGSSIDIDVLRALVRRCAASAKPDTVALKGKKLEEAKAAGKATTKEIIVYDPIVYKLPGSSAEINLDAEYTEAFSEWLANGLRFVFDYYQKIPTAPPIFGIGGTMNFPKAHVALKKYNIVVKAGDPVYANVDSMYTYAFGEGSPYSSITTSTFAEVSVESQKREKEKAAAAAKREAASAERKAKAEAAAKAAAKAAEEKAEAPEAVGGAA